MQLERHHGIVLAGPVEAVFPLFTPAGERLWVEGWDPLFVEPADGRTCEGMVFSTGSGAEATLWSCIDWRPETHRVRYVRVTPASRFGFVEVACRALADGRTEATVAYRFTALSDHGRATLAGFTEDAFVAMIEGWRTAIDRWLAADPSPCRPSPCRPSPVGGDS